MICFMYWIFLFICVDFLLMLSDCLSSVELSLAITFSDSLSYVEQTCDKFSTEMILFYLLLSESQMC